MRPKVSDRIPMLSRLLRSRLKRSAAGTSAATAVSNGGRGSPRASHIVRARKSSGATLNILRSSIRSEKRDA